MEKSNDRKVLDTLRQVSFFSAFVDNEEVLSMLAGLCSRRSFSQGKKIIEEGDYGDSLYIIVDGEIDIVKKTMQNEPYTVTTLSSAMGGIYVGELALIDDDRRSATVAAKTDCECLEIHRRDFEKLGDKHPELGLPITRAIAGQLAAKLRKANSDVITLFSALVEEIDVE